MSPDMSTTVSLVTAARYAPELARIGASGIKASGERSIDAFTNSTGPSRSRPLGSGRALSFGRPNHQVNTENLDLLRETDFVARGCHLAAKSRRPMKHEYLPAPSWLN